MIISKETNENVTKQTAVTSDGTILMFEEDGNYRPVISAFYEIKDYPIPSKEAFKKIINDIQDINQKNDKFNDTLRKVYADGIFYFPTLETTILSYLAELFDNKCNRIYYFICELDYGRSWKPGDVTVDGKDYKLATVDDLYDFLIENFNE